MAQIQFSFQTTMRVPRSRTESIVVFGGARAFHLFGDRGAKRWQGKLHGVPNDLRSSLLVVVPVDISHAGNVLPRDCRVL